MTKILIVDDSSFMRNSLKYIIESAGHKVIGLAKEGKEALELYKKLKPDIVTLDVLMDGVEGMTTLRKIMEENHSAKIIMVTAIGTEQKQQEAFKIGASGYITKPFKVEKVIGEIQKIIG